ncbi:MAG: tRNA 2-selenouridine(34) synthase MnmH [Flavisolibacter sp.]
MLPRWKHFLFTECNRYICKVGIQRLPISDFLQQCKGHLVLDVRSPGEYKHAHMPRAISFPLFTDEERKIVGTTYKQLSREQAIKIGLDMFGPKMRKMVEEVEGLVQSLKFKVQNEPDFELSTLNCIFLYCWRGGMRSAAIAWLLDLYGFKVHTLAGGYKAYRNHILRSLEQPYDFRIIGGYTGSGKTEVLNELKRLGKPVIDLEDLACHKGSAFGNYKMPPQPSQEMFENLLGTELLKKNSELSGKTGSIWLEDESQRIGNINIPSPLWETMRKSPLIFLEIPFEERLRHITEEYSQWEKEKLTDATKRISKRLGGLETKNTLEYLENDNFTEAFRILLNYYDKRYLNGLHNREQLLTLLTKLKSDTVSAENAILLTKYQPA